VSKHRGVRNRRAWWQLKHELKHRFYNWQIEFRADARYFIEDFKEWKANRGNELP
jgi:hypothetical protein